MANSVLFRILSNFSVCAKLLKLSIQLPVSLEHLQCKY